jgi:hypothetical protein
LSDVMAELNSDEGKPADALRPFQKPAALRGTRHPFDRIRGAG